MTAITADMMLPDFYDASGPDFTPSTSDYAALNTLYTVEFHVWAVHRLTPNGPYELDLAMLYQTP